MNDLVKLERPTADEEAACLDDIRQQLVTKRGANGKLTVLANIANLETVLRRHPETRDCFARNDFSGDDYLMVPIPGTEDAEKLKAFEPRPLEDHDYLAVILWLQRSFPWFANVAKALVCDAVDAVCAANRFDPLQDWVERCAATWDGEYRTQDLFVRYFIAAEQNAYTDALGEIAMMALVLRALDPGAHQPIVPVLQGSQGIGKSSGLAALCPRPEWFSDSLPALRTKDAQDHVRRHWVIELGEMDVARKSEVEELKAFLTRPHDTFRAAYGRKERTHPRRCMFWGTTNDQQYLRDNTGNDRFFPVVIERVDVEAMKRDRDQLVGEAVHLLREFEREGRNWWELSGEARSKLAKHRQQAEVADPWMGIIAAAIDGLDEVCTGQLMDEQVRIMQRDGTEGFTTKRGIGKPIQSRTPHDGRRIASILQKLGWVPDGRMPHGSPWPRTMRYVPGDRRHD